MRERKESFREKREREWKGDKQRIFDRLSRRKAHREREKKK